jgi:hypothetical protein
MEVYYDQSDKEENRFPVGFDPIPFYRDAGEEPGANEDPASASHPSEGARLLSIGRRKTNRKGYLGIRTRRPRIL